MKSSNKLLIIDGTLSIPWNYYHNVRIWYDISLIIKKNVMKFKYEYTMTSSDQILWIFSRLNGPIYSFKLILPTLNMQHIYCFCNYFVNPPSHLVTSSLIKLVLFHPLSTFLSDIKSLQTNCFPQFLKQCIKSWKSSKYTMTSFNLSELIQIAW